MWCGVAHLLSTASPPFPSSERKPEAKTKHGPPLALRGSRLRYWLGPFLASAHLRERASKPLPSSFELSPSLVATVANPLAWVKAKTTSWFAKLHDSPKTASVDANLREFMTGEVRRKPVPGTWVN